MSTAPLSRRRALAGFAALIAGSPSLRAQRAPRLAGEPPRRKTPLDAFANVPEFEPMAERALSDDAFARIAGGERRALERITFRARMMVNTLALDLSLDLLGQPMFAPILVGPASGQDRIHPDGERATATGAAAAKATLVTAEHSGSPLEETAALAPGAWRQLYPRSDFETLLGEVARAREAGCGAICLTLGVASRDSGEPASYGWDKIERLRDAAGLPLVLKGMMQPSDARAAADRGIAAIIVSNHGAGPAAGTSEPMSVLSAISEAAEGRIPILVDGGFRRGGDVLKAIALGATAALVCRPALWGLAAYGAAGVQKVVEMLQTELARDMVQVGAVNLAAIRRDHVRVHKR